MDKQIKIESNSSNKGQKPYSAAQLASAKAQNSRFISGIRLVGVLFLLVLSGLIVAIVFLSKQLDDSAKDINLAGRQRMLSQRITKASGNILTALRVEDKEGLASSVKELKSSCVLFDETILAFKEGGDTMGAGGVTVSLKKVKRPELVKFVDDAYQDWLPVTAVVNPLFSEDVVKISDEDALSLNYILQSKNLKILKNMNNLTVGLEGVAKSRALLIRILQYTAFVLATVNFVYLVFYAVRALKRNGNIFSTYSSNLEKNYKDLQKSNEDLGLAQKELDESNKSLQDAVSSLDKASKDAVHRANELEELTQELHTMQEESDTIFDSVDHGLCLLDSKFNIGSQISSAAFDIFDTDQLENRSFVDLMRPMITEKDQKTLDSFLRLLFRPEALDEQLERFNPLRKIEVTLDWDGVEFSKKHLSFQFGRIFGDDKVDAVLVTVTDISDTVVLESRLKKAGEDQERKMTFLMEIMQCGNIPQLKKFLTQSEEQLDQINDALKSQEVTARAKAEVSADVIDFVFRKIHNLKGNASMFNLSSIVEVAHEAESELMNLKEKEIVSGEEFLNSIVNLGQLRELFSDYEDTIHTVANNFSLTKSSAKLSTSEMFEADLKAFNKKVAGENAKIVHTNCEFELDLIDDTKLSEVKDIVIQLCRNSIYHGIEVPQDRMEKGKFKYGTIAIAIEKDNTSSNKLGKPSYVCKIKDDGQGLDLKKIKTRAIELNWVTEQQAETLSKADIINFIFRPNFSTAETVNNYAGRGVGLDLVKDKVINTLGGKLSLTYNAGNYTQIAFHLPADILENSLTPNS